MECFTKKKQPTKQTKHSGKKGLLELAVLCMQEKKKMVDLIIPFVFIRGWSHGDEYIIIDKTKGRKESYCFLHESQQ